MLCPDVDYGVPRDDELNTICHSNEEGFARLLKLYARLGQTIVDPTFGHGRFWKLVDREQYVVLATDIATGGPDLGALPYENDSVDVLVLDPPYRYTPAKHKAHEDTGGHGQVDGLYNLKASGLTNMNAVLGLYQRGLREARRVLRNGGFCFVKCQDTIQDGVQVWVHGLLASYADEIAFVLRDLLVVASPSVLKTRWARQRHLRKAHSYFLVFRKGGHFPFGIPATEKR